MRVRAPACSRGFRHRDNVRAAADPRVDGRSRAELFSADAMASRVVEAWRDLLEERTSGCNDPFNDVVRADGDPILDVRGPVPTRGSNDL